jgi:hypothetical protein
VIGLEHPAIETQMNRGTQGVFDFEHDSGPIATVAFLPLLPIFGATQVRRNLATAIKYPQQIFPHPPHRRFVNNLSSPKPLTWLGDNTFCPVFKPKCLRSGISPAKTKPLMVPPARERTRTNRFIQ